MTAVDDDGDCVGKFTISAAAVDMLCWPIMSVILQLKDAQSALAAFYNLLLYIGFVVLLVLTTPPLIRLLLKYQGRGAQFSEAAVGFVLVWFVGMMFLADMIGVHVIVASYMLGCAFPREGPTNKVLYGVFCFSTL